MTSVYKLRLASLMLADKALLEGWESIQEVLYELTAVAVSADNEQKADTRNQAEGFSRRMDELETAMMATVCMARYPWPSKQYEH